MNPKFFDVKKEKQDAIINAALKVFAENGYRKASTDVIVKEAGISKGLLFHYFISKSGVYEFIYDYSVKYMMLELTNAVNKKETDFFAIQRMIEACKTRVMKNYPYMQQFLSGAKYETHPDAVKIISASEKGIEDAYNTIYKKVDMSRFPKDVDLKKVIRMIGWMSDGYIKDKFMDGTPDLDEMNAEFAGYLAMLRARFYGKAEAEPVPAPEVIDTTDPVRDDSVMDSMRENTVIRLMEEKAEELSFEERLARGKKSAYDTEPEETAAENVETAAESLKTVEEIPEDVNLAEAAEESAETTEEGPAEEEAAAEEAAAEEAAIAEEDTEEEAEKAEAGEEAKAAETEETETEDIKEPEEEAEAEDTGSEGAATEEDESPQIKVSDMLDEKKEAPVPVETKFSKEKGKGKNKKSGKDKEMREVTLSIDDFSDVFKSYETYTYGGSGPVYAASGAVKTYIPDSKISKYYETSRLSDFTYGSDQRGGRGIPYDSSDNIQIFVDEDDDSSDDDIDLEGLTDKIMSNTERESAEFDRARELSEMGPAPVLPDFSPEKLRNLNDNMNDEDDENNHIYRPVHF